MKGHLLMSEKERARLIVMRRVRDQGMRLTDAARALGISYRQVLRIHQRFAHEEDKGLVHRSRGASSNRKHSGEFKAKVIARYQERFLGFGPTLAAEKMSEEGFSLDHETLRRWLLEAGLIKRRRKSSPHRSRRERRARFGELVQLDGSHHDWFEGRRGPCCLMNMVDDATGATMSFMSEKETTEAAMTVLRAWVERHGVPAALYADRHSVYASQKAPSIEEELAGRAPLTAFGRTCKKLGVEIITAYSPQAKGRVERSNGVYQDRLVKEMRLSGAATIEEANQILTGGFFDKLNGKFAVEPCDPQDAHVPPGDTDLASVFSLECARVVANDYTVRHKNHIYQLARQKGLPRPGEKVVVQRRMSGEVCIIYRKSQLTYALIVRPDKKKLPAIEKVLTPAEASGWLSEESKIREPAKNHPWRKLDIRRQRQTVAR